MNTPRFRHILFLLFLLVTAVFTGTLSSVSAFSAATDVFINEIHYDNVSTDTGEAIEIAGPAGTDLTGWSILLYNGNGGVNYNATPLTGTIPDQGNGFGTVVVTYPPNSLQNGSPDGIALIDASATVVQFLSYEGTFVAFEGPANGLASTDIGVAESSGTPIGSSLQLTGTGNMYADFTWASEAASTFGASNNGQTFTGGSSGPTDPLINEFVFNHTGTDTQAFIEVLGDASTDYSAYTVLEIEGDSPNAGIIDAVLPVSSTDANGFWLSSEDVENGTATLLLVEDFTGSAGDDIDADDDGIIDNAPWTAVTDSIAVTDGGGSDYTYGDTTLISSFDGGIFTVGGASRIPNGTDTNTVSDWVRNDYDGAGFVGFTGTPVFGEAINTPAATNEAVPQPTPTGLVINEMDYDQPGSDTAEFVEILNVGTETVSLNGIDLVLINGSNDSFYNAISLPNVQLAAGDFYVVCGDSANVANCDLDTSPDTNLLQNGAPDAVALTFDTSVLDAVSYEGDVAAPYVEGSGAGLLDDSAIDYAGISRYPDGTDTAQNNVDLSQRCITPGAANTDANSSCPEPQIGSLVINEIDYDQDGTDAAEFVEIYNASNAIINLATYELVLVNGNGASAYNTTALPNVNLNPGQYFVVCGDAANVQNCDLDISPDTNLVQNGAPDAAALIEGGVIIDTVSYEGNVAAPYTEGSGSGLEDSAGDGYSGISRYPNGVDTNQNNVDLSQRCATPGEANTDENTACVPPVIEACGNAFTPIYDIQGNGLASALDGSVVSTEGIVTATFFDTNQMGGFYMQDAAGDGDAATSDGIYVFTTFYTPAVGDKVRVKGTVDEFFDLTEITSVSSYLSCGVETPITPTEVTLPVASIDDFEAFEGMLVTFPQQLTVSNNFTLGRYGEIELSVNGRLFQPTNVTTPGAAANALQDLNNRSRIQLDDGSNVQNPVPLPPYFNAEGTLRLGDTTDNLTAVMGYGFGVYELQPVDPVVFNGSNPRTDAPDVGGSVQVASFNVLNYFTTIDNGSSICGPLANQGCRGADTPDEFTRQHDKIVDAIVSMDADVVGLIEIENHATDDALAFLVNGLNAVAGPGTYDYIPTGPIGDDAIKVAFIYQPANVTPVGAYAILDSSVDPLFLDDFNRPALAQTFADNGTGGTFTAVINHLKSKGSDCNDVGDIDTGDGQGNCNITRTNAATALANWLATDPTSSGDPDFLIVGDLNAYAMEDPIVALTGLGYTNLVDAYNGKYSYQFQGQSGYLDHALSNPPLTTQVTGVAPWHINGDEPSALDYNNYNQAELYDADPYRASDHDPIMVGINVSPYILNGNGCVVIALEGSPFDGLATVVEAKNGRFNALTWKHEQGLPADTCFEIHGTNSNDRIYGAYADDTIFGYDGNDKLYGKDGNDTLIGGVGNDYINGNLGDFDRLFGDEGNDRLVDGDGVLEAHGGSGNDKLTLTQRYGWLAPNGQKVVEGITGGYDNDTVRLTLKDQTGHYFVSISGDEYDDPPSPNEGNDSLKLRGHITPDSEFIKFENTNIR